MSARSNRSSELSGKRKRHHTEPAELAVPHPQPGRAVAVSDAREAADEAPSPSKRIKPLHAKASSLPSCKTVTKLCSLVHISECYIIVL